jgi:valyl-tRNA synthetase
MTEPKLKDKNWEARFEKELFSKWNTEGLYKFDIGSPKKILSIDTPPPYVSGHWHPGAVAGYSLYDMIVRTARMSGYSVYFPMCLDRNGIVIDRATEKKYGKSMHDYPREEFIKLCEQLITEYGDSILEVAKIIGMSCDFDNVYKTDSEDYRTLTQATFIDLWKKGLVYEDYRPSNYCPSCKTVIADAEVEYEEKDTTLYYVYFKVKETMEKVEIATTRPELLCACQAVLVHPDDERYGHLHGKNIIIPHYNREVPVIPHGYAKPEFGTGIVMICSFGDQGDVALFRELNLEPIVAIDTNARMTEKAGKYAGLSVTEARKALAEDLKKDSLVFKEEKIMHRTPVCERCKTPIEFIMIKEYYLKQLEYLDDIRKQADKIRFYPPRNKQILINWIESVKIDWPISRRRYYSTEIPLWYCKSCGRTMLPKPGKYYRPWIDKAPFRKCPKCGGKEFIGETRVFDTWMDSSISNLYVAKYKKDKQFFKKVFPNMLRPQGRDIVRTWLFYTMLKSRLLLKKRAWKYAFITGMGLDEEGKKMSKSLGNYVEVRPLLDKYGADSYRFWAAAETKLGDDFRISVERIEGASKFLNKLWNISRFISMFEEREKPEHLAEADRWILAGLEELVKGCENGYKEYDFFVPANAIRDFVWNVFAPHYIEMVKSRAYSGDQSALYTVHTALKTLLKLLAPICPFVTDKIYRDVYNASVHKEQLPKAQKWDRKLTRLTEKVIEFDSKIWKEKKEKNLPLNAEYGAKVPKKLMMFETDLRAMHKLK